MKRLSLRMRLFMLILCPLIIVAIILGYWRLYETRATAEDIFDKNLLSAALAISRDIAVSQGDALSLNTRQLIEGASGGEVFYHVMGLNGVYLTGYAYPPLKIDKTQLNTRDPIYYDAHYRGEDVRVFQMKERLILVNLRGEATITVWQRIEDRNRFFISLAWQTAILMGALLFSLAIIVWFAVALGLRPLLNLQEAISLRSSDDLTSIKRPVPKELKGIVSTLNRLFLQLSDSFKNQQEFISNAAHQLRNPAASVLAMAETAQKSQTEEEKHNRLNEVVNAAKNMVHISKQLLSLDQLQVQELRIENEICDFVQIAKNIITQMGADILRKNIELEVHIPHKNLYVCANPIFLGEAFKNLLDNALKHGGMNLSKIVISVSEEEDKAVFTIIDDGIGLSHSQSEFVFKRFSQIGVSEGSGLGLAIVKTFTERYHGDLRINDIGKGASLTLRLPRSKEYKMGSED